MTTDMENDPGWLFVLGDRTGLDWVTENNRMAFVKHLSGIAKRIQPGDVAFLYGTKRLIGGPVGRVLAMARITGSVTTEPLKVEGGWNFSCWCPLRFEHRVAEQQGPAIRDLVGHLEFIKRKDQWSHYLRRGLVRLYPGDVRFLRDEMKKLPAID